MEPVEATIRIIYTIYVRADKVEQREGLWWVHFTGSWESIRFGETKPWEEGDMVKITFEKVIQNA